MVTKTQLLEKLKGIYLPGSLKNPVELNLVKDINIIEDKVEIKIHSATLEPDAQKFLETRIQEIKAKTEGIAGISVVFENVNPKEANKITHVIAVMSGKGGVGKSLISGLSAVALKRQGYSVGILDADITGPSIPRMFGVKNGPEGTEEGIIPLSTSTGIEIISVNLLLPNENEAVIWRGPIIARVITQFWEEVLWGQLDYLIVDLPPGTADAPLTVLQQIPVSGIVIVSSPQELAAMIVKKAVSMAKKMDKRIIGVIENMSYLYVPEIKKKIELFGPSTGEDVARSAGAELIAQIPIDPDLAQLCDKGRIEDYKNDVVDTIGASVSRLLPVKKA